MDWTGENDDSLTIEGFAEGENRSPVTDFRDLRVWQAGMQLAKTIYKSTANFPREEVYGLTSQIRRAAVSIPANIAEGYGRETTGVYIQFLRIAQGSAKEVETLLILAHELKFIPHDNMQTLQSQIHELSKMLRSLLRKLQQRAKP